MNTQLELKEFEAILAGKDASINTLQKEKQALNQENQTLKQENQELKERIDQLLRERFGKKSEQTDPTPDSTFDEPELTPEEQETIGEAEAQLTVGSYTRKSGKKKPLPAELPRVQEIHDLPEAERFCSCGHALHCIGEEKAEKLDIIPAKIRVIEQIRKKYGCRSCENGIRCAAIPPAMVHRSVATPGLLAHVVLSKYEDHLPLYRQESIWRRLGVELPRSTLCHWVLSVGEALEPLMAVIREEIKKTGYVQADETPVQILNEKETQGTKKGYMWVFLSGNAKERPAVCYQFATSRKKETATEFFADYQGIVQSDGFSGYDHLSKQPGIVQANCWTHARRPFYKLTQMTQKPGAAQYMVSQIQKLYRIEKEMPVEATYEEIKAIRQQKSAPLLEELHRWLVKKQSLTPPKGLLGQAIAYTLEHWEGLTRYLLYGRLKIDNNDCENIIRPFAVGRKNWLFLGNERGGVAAANLYSLIQTCRLNKINSYAYLRFLFTEFPKRPKKDKEFLRSLLPQYCTEEQLASYLL